MAFQLPPIVKAAQRLVVETEQVVRRFVRYHRYQIGSELRTQAMTVYDIAERAWRDRKQQVQWVDKLVWAIDSLLRKLQVAKLIQATQSFRQFEQLLRLTTGLGRQAGGWRRHLRLTGQNAQGPKPAAQCAQTLSTCAASAGANR